MSTDTRTYPGARQPDRFRQVNADNVGIAVYEWGRESDPVVFLVHGGSDFARTFDVFGPLIAAFTSAPLQEASRAIILSTAARRVRDVRPSTAFGFGHGAIDLLTSSLIPTLSAVIILGGVRDGSIFVGLDAEVTEKVNAVAVFLTSQSLLSAVLLIVQGALMLGLHALLTAIVLRVVVRGGGARTVGRGLLLPIAAHTPVAVVRTLFPMATTPVLLGALLVVALVYRRGQGPMAESAPIQ